MATVGMEQPSSKSTVLNGNQTYCFVNITDNFEVITKSIKFYHFLKEMDKYNLMNRICVIGRPFPFICSFIKITF